MFKITTPNRQFAGFRLGHRFAGGVCIIDSPDLPPGFLELGYLVEELPGGETQSPTEEPPAKKKRKNGKEG